MLMNGFVGVMLAGLTATGTLATEPAIDLGQRPVYLLTCQVTELDGNQPIQDLFNGNLPVQVLTVTRLPVADGEAGSFQIGGRLYNRRQPPGENELPVVPMRFYFGITPHQLHDGQVEMDVVLQEVNRTILATEEDGCETTSIVVSTLRSRPGETMKLIMGTEPGGFLEVKFQLQDANDRRK